jgi:hypothetical protein
MKVSILKPVRKRTTVTRIAVETLVDEIRDAKYGKEVSELRDLYPQISFTRNSDGSLVSNYSLDISLPRICFAEELENRKGDKVALGYNGLVVLEINNLQNYDEAMSIRDMAARVPQTFIAMLGASGRSVRVVCRGELFPDERQDSHSLPSDVAVVSLFHLNLYNQARKAYQTQLDVTVEKLEPRLDHMVYMTADPDIYYNPVAIPIYASGKKQVGGVSAYNRPYEAKSAKRKSYRAESEWLLPGRNEVQTQRLMYHYCLNSVMGPSFPLPSQAKVAELLMKLAVECLKARVPMGMAQNMTLLHPAFNDDIELVKLTFQNVYAADNARKYLEKSRIKPFAAVPEDSLLMMKTDIFLNENYELRKNVMTGVAQYRIRDGYQFEFHDLDTEARNMMTIEAKKAGLKSWDRDIERYIESPYIEQYDPVNNYLDQLPSWDGQDRIKAIAGRVPNKNPHWEEYLHRWMLAMVAHWMGRNALTGNALVPLLIGRQGCGKTSFCRILLPPQLRDYYNDRINFKNENDLNMGLTSFALVNIDEFDKTTARQQVLLKYLLSTQDVKFRPPYGKAYKQYRRYASFIGTTNYPTPLTDPTGSRRFVCVDITGDIDFSDSIEHRQVYAQLKNEVEHGVRYWLNDEEIQTLISENAPYVKSNGVEEMIFSLYAQATDEDNGEWLSAGAIAETLRERFSYADTRNLSIKKIGHILNNRQLGITNKRTNKGTVYWMKKK